VAAARLIPGYKYDIFISYLQKDNKQLGWVIEFVVKAPAPGHLESLYIDHRKSELNPCYLFWMFWKNDLI
jgi:hypothetical protein